MIAKRPHPKINNRNVPRRQQGAALLIALVIMTISIGIAANIMFRQQLHTRLASNISNLEQAYPYVTALEDFAKKTLSIDSEEFPESDNLKEKWATKLPPIPIPGGSMTGGLFDLQAKLNLNNLYPSKFTEADKLPPQPEPGQDPLTPEELAQIEDYNRYIMAKNRTDQLMAVIDPDETVGPNKNFSGTVQDWIDGDSVTSPGGAESLDYQSQDPAYNAANSFLVSDTELRLLKDIDTKAYKLIKPFIATLPVIPKYTAVNVNTAPLEVIQALGFTPEAAESIISERGDNPFQKMEDFLFLGAVSAATEGEEPSVDKQYLSVTSSYFLLQGEINIGTARLYINSILHRKDGKVTVVSRDFSNQHIDKAQELEE